MVASSIGEEGLDIGEIDLIVCYEANKSPIRMVSTSGNSTTFQSRPADASARSCNAWDAQDALAMGTSSCS